MSVLKVFVREVVQIRIPTFVSPEPYAVKERRVLVAGQRVGFAGPSDGFLVIGLVLVNLRLVEHRQPETPATTTSDSPNADLMQEARMRLRFIRKTSWYDCDAWIREMK